MVTRLKLAVSLLAGATLLAALVGLVAAAPVQLSGRVTDQASTGIAGATVDVLQPGTATVVASTTTNSTGDYNLSFEAGTYDVRVTPPAGSGLQVTTVTNRSIGSNDTLDFALVPAGAVTLRGTVRGGLGGGVPDVNLTLFPVGGGAFVDGAADSDGAFALQAAPGSYTLRLERAGLPVAGAPSRFQFSDIPVALSGNAALALTLPAKRVSVHVQDPAGNPAANVALTTTTPHLGATDLGAASAPFAFAGYPAPGVTTDAAGDAVLWLPPTNAGNPYTVTATPPGGGVATNVPGVMVPRDRSLTITLAGAVTLSGTVRGGLGGGVPQVQLVLRPSGGGAVVDGATNAGGAFALQAAPGSYTLDLDRNAPPVAGAPAYLHLTGSPMALSADVMLDLTLPARRVSVHVQDPAGNPAANVALRTNLPVLGPANLGPVTAPFAQGGYPNGGVTTDAAGDAVLWLLPTNGSERYIIIADPPPGSPFATVNVTNIAVTADRSLVVALQFVHAPPVTTASFSPPAVGGVHPGPVTVTLSATAAPGFSVASTKYRVDGGAEQAYTAPFTISGNGSHTLVVQSVDNAGVFEAPKEFTVQIQANAAPTISAIPNQTIVRNTATAALPFTVGDAEMPAASLVVSGSSGNQVLVPNANIVFGGAGANRTVTVTPAPNQTGAATITVTVGDGSKTASTTFTLTVNNPIPTLTSISPDAAAAGGPAFTLTLVGTNFVDNSSVRFDGTPLQVLTRTPTQITATVAAGLITTVRVVDVWVTNLGPGGGDSNKRPFTVTESTTATCDGRPATIVGTSRGEVLRGTAGADVIVGGGGRDVVRGQGGDDVICVGDQDSTVHGGPGNDRILAGDGHHRLHGDGGDDHLQAGNGNNLLEGDGGADTLIAGSGSNTFRGGVGTDTCTGGGPGSTRNSCELP
jgi:hypothetical protein